MAIGNKLKKTLEQKKLTVTQLSRDSGVSKNTIYGIIKRDNQTLSPNVAVKIAKTLRIPLGDLMFWDDGDEARNKILSAYDSLNAIGQIEAEKRIMQLTEMYKYQK